MIPKDYILNDFYNYAYVPQTIVMLNKLYIRELWDNLRFIKGKYHEDECIIYEVFHKCDYINMTLESLNYYFQRADSIMSSKDK